MGVRHHSRRSEENSNEENTKGINADGGGYSETVISMKFAECN